MERDQTARHKLGSLAHRPLQSRCTYNTAFPWLCLPVIIDSRRLQTQEPGFEPGANVYAVGEDEL